MMEILGITHIFMLIFTIYTPKQAKAAVIERQNAYFYQIRKQI